MKFMLIMNSPRDGYAQYMSWPKKVLYLRLDSAAKTAAALMALVAIPPIALWLTRPLLSLADDPVHVASGRAWTRFIYSVATLPALMAILLIIPFRIPRDFVEVVVPPVVVTTIGIVWIQGGRLARQRSESGRRFGHGIGCLSARCCSGPSLRVSSSDEAGRSLLLGAMRGEGNPQSHRKP